MNYTVAQKIIYIIFEVNNKAGIICMILYIKILKRATQHGTQITFPFSFFLWGKNVETNIVLHRAYVGLPQLNCWQELTFCHRWPALCLRCPAVIHASGLRRAFAVNLPTGTRILPPLACLMPARARRSWLSGAVVLGSNLTANILPRISNYS